jgi:hypothetical protein
VLSKTTNAFTSSYYSTRMSMAKVTKQAADKTLRPQSATKMRGTKYRQPRFVREKVNRWAPRTLKSKLARIQKLQNSEFNRRLRGKCRMLRIAICKPKSKSDEFRSPFLRSPGPPPTATIIPPPSFALGINLATLHGEVS